MATKMLVGVATMALVSVSTAGGQADTAWSHAMDKNCCGGGEACGFVYCLGQDKCIQPWMMDDFAADCAPGAAKTDHRRLIAAEPPAAKAEAEPTPQAAAGSYWSISYLFSVSNPEANPNLPGLTNDNEEANPMPERESDDDDSDHRDHSGHHGHKHGHKHVREACLVQEANHKDVAMDEAEATTCTLTKSDKHANPPVVGTCHVTTGKGSCTYIVEAHGHGHGHGHCMATMLTSLALFGCLLRLAALLARRQGFSSGLFGCFQDPKSCLVTMVCPCWTYGRVAAHGLESAHQTESDKSCLRVAFCLGYVCCAASTGFQMCFSVVSRWILRKKHALPNRLPTSSADSACLICTDAFVHSVAHPCALCQEARELDAELAVACDPEVVMAQPASISIQCPLAAGPGSSVQICLPDGSMAVVAVPAGVVPGQAFAVALPGSAPQKLSMDKGCDYFDMPELVSDDSSDDNAPVRA